MRCNEFIRKLFNFSRSILGGKKLPPVAVAKAFKLLRSYSVLLASVTGFIFWLKGTINEYMGHDHWIRGTKIYAILPCIMLLCGLCLGESPSRTANSGLELQVTPAHIATHFTYSIPNSELVRTAWIEVLDRPLILDRKPVVVQAKGELDWAWDTSGLNDSEEPDDKLLFYIWDPNGETITCDVNTVMTVNRGGEVEAMLIGARENFDPDPVLYRSFVRVAQGGQRASFVFRGSGLTPQATFEIQAKEGGKCDRSSMHAEVLDLTHARITLSRQCLRKTGVFHISAGDHDDKDYGVQVQVASRGSPVLQSVSPSNLPADTPQDKLMLVLHGSGFTRDSTVYAGYYPTASDAEDYIQFPLITEYVSLAELHARIDPESLNSSPVGERVWSRGEKLRVWVIGNKDQYELSEARDVEIQPTLEVQHKQTAVITSITPFPIQLMDEHSPEELKVTIHGENFVPQNRVILDVGPHYAPNHKEVRSEYVSPHLLQAWIPRQRWRKHQIIYRLVVETTSGQRYTQQVDDTSDGD